MVKNKHEDYAGNLIREYMPAKNTRPSADALMVLISNILTLSKLKPNLRSDNPLTVAEMVCMILLAMGKNPDQCADFLKVSVETIRTFEQRIRKKLGAKNRTNAFYIAFIQGYITVSM